MHEMCRAEIRGEKQNIKHERACQTKLTVPIHMAGCICMMNDD